jgi:hypothetical protein
MRKIRKLPTVVITLLFCLATVPRPVHAQGVDLIAGAVVIGGGLVVKKLLSDAEQRISNVLADADARARLVVAAGSEAAFLLLEQAKQNLKDVMDRAFQDLNESRQAMMKDLYAAIYKLERSVKDATITASIELTKWGQSNLFWAESLPFLIKSVKPFLIVKQSDAMTYPVELRGLGFGIDEGNKKFAIKFAIAGVDVEQPNFDRQPDGVTVNVPNSIFSNYFVSSRPSKIPTTFTSTITSEKPCWLLFTCKDTNTYSSTFNLTVYPEKAARFTLEQTATQPALGEFFSPPRRETVRTASGHPDGAHRLTIAGVYTAEPGYVFVYPQGKNNFLVGCAGQDQSCQFFHSLECPITLGGRQVKCTSVTTSHTLTLTYEFPQRRATTQPVSIPDVRFDWAFGETKRIEYRADASSVRLYGTLASGEEVNVSIVPPMAAASEWLTCLGAADIGAGKKKVDCRLQAPPQ